MVRETIKLQATLAELDRWTNAHCAEPGDEPARDLDGNPLTDRQALALVRDLERRTGKQLIFRSDDPDAGSGSVA